jgi:hypothetical protein
MSVSAVTFFTISTDTFPPRSRIPNTIENFELLIDANI